jgi:hypothetical protein
MLWRKIVESENSKRASLENVYHLDAQAEQFQGDC